MGRPARGDIVGHIQEEFRELQLYWSARDSEIQEMRKLFFLDHYGAEMTSGNIGGVDNYRLPARGRSQLDASGAYRVTSSEYTDYILALRAMLVAQPPIIRAYSDKDSKIADEAAQTAEKLLMGVRYVNHRRSERDFLDTLIDSILVTGWGIIYTYWDTALAKHYGEEGNWLDFPIVIRCLPPEHCYPRPGGRYGRWQSILYTWERPVAEIEEEWEIDLWPKKTSPPTLNDKLRFYDFWEWKGKEVWQTVVAGQKVVKGPVNMSKYYSTLPYTIIMGITTSSDEAGQCGLSALYTLRPNVELQEDLLSRIMTIATHYADPALVANDGDGAPIQMEKTPGSIIHLRTGQSITALPGIGVSDDVFKVLQWNQGAVQRAGLPTITYGQGMTGLSGYAISLLGQGGSMKSILPGSNINLGLSLAFDKILELCRRFSPDKPLYVHGQDRFGKMFSAPIRGNELKGLYVDVRLKPKIPQDEVARANRARLLKGVTSDFYILDNVLELQDPVADRKRQLVELFQRHPVILAQEMAREAKEWGYDVPPEIFLQGMAMAKPGERTPNAAAPIPTVPAVPPPPPEEMDEIARLQMERAAAGKMPGPEEALPGGMYGAT